MSGQNDKDELTEFDIQEFFRPLNMRWTIWDYITLPFWRLISKLEQVKFAIKMWYQRRTRGFDDTQWWSLDIEVCKMVLPRLKHFKENAYTIPCEFACGEDGPRTEEWNLILDKMIYAFEAYLIDYEDAEPISEWRGKFDKDGYLFEQKRINEGFELFGKHLANLSD